MPVAETDSAVERPAGRADLSEHLANERTYLAYLRTSVSLMSFGIAINRFSLFLAQSNSARNTAYTGSPLVSSERLGIGMVALGMALLVWAAIHYSQTMRQIERRDFRPRPGNVMTLTLLVLLVGLSSVFGSSSAELWP